MLRDHKARGRHSQSSAPVCNPHGHAFELLSSMHTPIERGRPVMLGTCTGVGPFIDIFRDLRATTKLETKVALASTLFADCCHRVYPCITSRYI